MKPILCLAFILCATTFVYSQDRMLKQSITLLMPRTIDDENPGTRGASVAWHPVQKKYYAAMAGNGVYPMAVFDAKGKLLSDQTLECMFDTRGLWYNPGRKQIEGNGYGETGWFTYKLNAKGIPSDTATLMSGKIQPTEQSVGAYNSKSNEVLFLENNTVYTYSSTGSVTGSMITIHWGQKKGSTEPAPETDATPEDYNYTTIVYTGIPKAEIGVLNKEKQQVELYDLKDGYLTTVLRLPEGTPLNTSFNFAYCNGMFWFFDMDKRTWYGCK